MKPNPYIPVPIILNVSRVKKNDHHSSLKADLYVFVVFHLIVDHAVRFIFDKAIKYCPDHTDIFT